jgi:two-component system response regulator AtoC
MAEATGPVLVVDDDPAVGKVLGALLTQAGLQNRFAPNAAEALAALQERPFDVVVTDLRMPGMDGLELLRRVAASWPETSVVMLTAHGTIPLAVEAMKAGAADFVLKPFDREEILYVIRKALVRARGRDLPSAATTFSEPGWITGSTKMQDVLKTIQLAASGTATVLIRGESGTGKDVVARAIHRLSERSGRPLIKFQSASLPESLLESELFGYEKGAFTGAACRKPGRLELAEGGTLFLDEIGDVSLSMQVKLLRLLQDREFETLGGTRTHRADVRYIAATHRDLESMIQKAEFRQDLFYRLNVVPIWLPPLRARPEEIELLALHFCANFAVVHRRPNRALEPEAIELLRSQKWPGNVRQLQNLIERLVIFSDLPQIAASDVQRELARDQAPAVLAVSEGSPSLDAQRLAAERQALTSALQRADNNRSLAARLLGISRRTLYNKLETHGLLQQ